MCTTLPKKVSGKNELNYLAVLEGDLVLGKNANVTVNPGCKLIIKDNSKIVVKKGAKLDILGETEICDNVQIQIYKGGKVSLNEADCQWGKNSQISAVK